MQLIRMKGKMHSRQLTRMQGYSFASDIKMCTGICLGDVQFTQCINKIEKLKLKDVAVRLH